MSDDVCSCPTGRPLGMPHNKGCPESTGEVLVFRQPDTGRPVGVPHDVVSAAERAFAAYGKKLEGKSWSLIAAEGGWPSAQACQSEVTKYLNEGRAALATWKRVETMMLWRDRLEMLWEAVVPAAKEGKVPSIMAGLSVAKTAMTLEGLDQSNEEDTGVPTVVVPSEEYLEFLKNHAMVIDDDGEGQTA